MNATNHLDNAWARLERNELGFDAFCDAFEAETVAAGGRIDARDLFAMFSGQLRPDMVEAVRRCGQHFKTGLLTNNFVTPISDSGSSALAEVLALFDVVVESSVVGVRKPDERFYLLACDALDITPVQAVFLDDLGVNLKPARALGHGHHQGDRHRHRAHRARSDRRIAPALIGPRSTDDTGRPMTRVDR